MAPSPLESVIIAHDDLSEAVAAQQRILIPCSRTDMPFGLRRSTSALSPSPLMISQSMFRKMASIHTAVDKAVHALVEQWPKDAELQGLIEMPERVAALLKPREGSPAFRAGSVRPDFVFDAAGDVKVTDINTRFPLNGFLTTAKLSEGILHETHSPDSIMARLNVSPVSATLGFVSALKARLVPDESDPVVFHLRGREHMLDTAMLPKALGVMVRQVPPSQLAVGAGPDQALCMREQDGTLTPIRSALLELQRDELLELPHDVMEALADLSHAGRTLNDLRTIFLAHDKAFLHVITKEMLPDIDEETKEILRAHVVPTIKMDTENIVADPFGPAVSRVVKPATSDKVDGAVMEKTIGTEDFNMYLKKLPRDQSFVLQSYVQQLKMETVDLDGAKRFLYSIGGLCGLDGDFYGPSVMQCNDSDLVSAASGGFPLVPAMRMVPMPMECKSFCHSLETADTTAINAALREHGIAQIGTCADLTDKEAVQAFLVNGLGAQCRTHSDVEGAVWDVRPVSGWNTTYARSHTTMPFEVHTDASFESCPPRFVAMAVIRSDHFGGGGLSVIRISDAIKSALTEEETQTLLNACPRWIVPPEFFRAGAEEVRAPVLMSRNRARFRCDKLCTEHMPEDEARQFREAFASFRGELESSSVDKTMVVPEQTIIILDNQRFAHARSHVFDMKRHLLRIRFDLPHVSVDM